MLLVALVLSGVVILGLRSLAHAMTYPVSTVPLPSDASLAGVGAGLVEYVTDDGVALRGARFEGKPDSPVVLFFHGNGESAVHRLPLGAELAKSGIGSFLAEYRGYGGCAGRPSEAGLYRDGEAAMRALGAGPERIVFVGQSLGSGLAAELAVRHATVNGLVLVSPYTSLLEMGRIVAGPLAYLGVSDRFDTLSKIGRVHCPITILHGVNDEVIPFAMGERLAKARPDATFVAIRDRGHNDIEDLGKRIAEAMRSIAPRPAR